jgi:phosphatidylserine decarboxylase
MDRKDWRASLVALQVLLEEREDLRAAVVASLKAAADPDITGIVEFYGFIEKILTEIPTQRELSPSVERFYYLISLSPTNLLRHDQAFGEWRTLFVRQMGNFLDSTESALRLDTFIDNPEYKVEDYDAGPSGWLTFNQFFARRTKPGRRPVSGLCDDSVIVSAADSMYLGGWPIGQDSSVMTKGVSYTIPDLLDGSPYRERFRGGLFTHSFLAPIDYHRYHTPVGGIVRESRVIQGTVWMDTLKNRDGSLSSTDGVGFQFFQTRGLLVIESAVGLVAVIPVGMGHVSSVNLTAEAGECLVKGEEFGYFCYGGSDMILLFEQDRAELTALPGVHYKQGEAIGRRQTAL